MSVLIKNHLNYLKDGTLECFFRSIIDFYLLKKENIIKDIRNCFRLKKSLITLQLQI